MTKFLAEEQSDNEFRAIYNIGYEALMGAKQFYNDEKEEYSSEQSFIIDKDMYDKLYELEGIYNQYNSTLIGRR